MREKLIALSIVKKGNWNKIYNFLRQDKRLDSINDVVANQLVDQLDCEVITIMDEDYPSAWHEMSKPPFVIYLQGNRKLLFEKIVTVVGGKTINEYTKKEIGHIMRQLSTKSSVATGFEHGVEAHVNAHARSRIVCLSTGFKEDGVYYKHESYNQITVTDLMMSELPPIAKFDLQAYYRSYHLIAELSQVVCVFELPNFDLRVKYLNYLTEVGKRVVVLPDKKNRYTAGGLGLINRGAKCLLHVDDVLEYLAE